MTLELTRGQYAPYRLVQGEPASDRARSRLMAAQYSVTTADGNPDFDLLTDLEPESRIRQAKEPRRQPVFLRRVGDPL